MVDMEEEPSNPDELSDIYKRLFDFPYESLSPQAAAMLYAFLQSYDPERQAQYSQIQVSHLPDGGGSGATGIAQRRAITHVNGRVIGHNLLQKHFLDVANDDRIKQNDTNSYPLPKQPTTQQRINYISTKTFDLSNQGVNLLQASPVADPTLPDILVPSPPKAARRVKPKKTAKKAQPSDTPIAVVQLSPPAVATATTHKKPSPIELLRPDPADPIRTEPTQSTDQVVITIEGDDDFPVSMPAPVTFRSLAQRSFGADRPLSLVPARSHDDQITDIRRNVEISESRKRLREQINTPPNPPTSSEEDPLRTPSFGFPSGNLASIGNPFGQNLSSSSINEPPASRMRPDFGHLRPSWSQSYSQTSMAPGHVRRESGDSIGSGRGRSLSRESRSSYPDDDRLFRYVDETLLDQSQFGVGMDVLPPAPPPYPCEQSMTATQFLEQDDSFYAGRPLEHFDTNNVSEILAIGDSMFHRVRFPGRNKRQADKVSFGGGRIPEIKIYLESSGRCKRRVIILCMGHNDLLKRRKRNRNLSLEHIFKLYVAFIDWIVARYSPEVVMICTLVPIAMETWFNAEAEQINAYILAYAQHNSNVIVLDLYNRLRDEVQDDWSEYYDQKLLHPNESKGAPIVNDVVNFAVDFYMQDREEILTSTRLTTTQKEADYFRGSYIMDPHNICRRKYQKSIQRDLGDPIAPRQQVNLTVRRQAEETVPEAWHKGLGNAPPYVADYESADPKPLPTVTKEGCRVHHLALVLQEKIARLNRSVHGSAPLMPLSRAKDIVYNQILEGRKKTQFKYKMEEVFDANFIQTKPHGIRHGVLEADDALWEDSPEHEIFDAPRHETSDTLIDSGHHQVVGALKPMRGTGYLMQSEQYPSSLDAVANTKRYDGNFSHHRLVSSLAWYQLNELRGVKILIISDSTLDPATHFPYLHRDVALIVMPQSTLQQRAALAATISETIEQANPIVVMFGFFDHLDLQGHFKKLLADNVTTEDLYEAVVSIRNGCSDARKKLQNEMTRVLFVAGPGYNQWPASIQKVIAIVALMYRDVEATLCGGGIPVDDDLRPRRIDYPRLIAELSKTISTMPLLEGVELTVDDCLLREHKENLHLIQPKYASGMTSDPSLASIRKVENTMRIVGDGLGVRVIAQKRVKTRISTENTGKISRRFMECRQDVKSRTPQHDAIIETKTFDTWQNPASAYREAPVGISLLRLHASKELRLRLDTDCGESG